MTDPHATRDQRAFGLLEDLEGWQYVDEGQYGHTYWLIPSRSNPAERYRVTPTWCSCLDYAYRGWSEETCKHIRALRAVLRVLRTSPQTGDADGDCTQ